ncbi:hypothetical protein SPAN111604_01850 [Sphingomonas antarctica]|uniref:DUF2332 domain-containing protein n=1 Tax=Sphingomonas antarctica TaxID=2040274 RepID=UPI0039ED465B
MTVTPLEAFAGQVQYCDANDTPVTSAICSTLIAALDDTTLVGRRVLGWPGNATKDAVPLRLVGGIHNAWRGGNAPELAALFERGDIDVTAMQAFLARASDALLPWLDGPPQTNEPGRSAQLMTGLLEIAARHGPKLEILEIGSSAGLNLLIDRFHIDLGGVTVGPEDSTVRLKPDWRGAPPPDVPLDIVSLRGVDVAPIDATDPRQADRLLSYVWFDQPQRAERVAAAIQMQRDKAVVLDKGDAADWIEERLAEPQPEGVTRVVMHSIVWQYIGAAGQARITTAIEAAGANADARRPLAWLRVEANRTVHRHEVTIRSWPCHARSMLIGFSHAHGFWVERLAEAVPGDVP